MPVEKIDAKITLTPTQIGELVKAANAPSPTIFERLRCVGSKYLAKACASSPMFSTAASSRHRNVTCAYSTINSALKLISVLARTILSRRP